MAEKLTRTTPITYPSTTEWRIGRVDLNWTAAIIHIELAGTNGERKEHDYRGPEATSLMLGLNKADLSIKSLHKRVLEKLAADGVLTGSITGIPD